MYAGALKRSSFDWRPVVRVFAAAVRPAALVGVASAALNGPVQDESCVNVLLVGG